MFRHNALVVVQPCGRALRGIWRTRLWGSEREPVALPLTFRSARRTLVEGLALIPGVWALAMLRTAILDRPPGTREDGICAHRHHPWQGERPGGDRRFQSAALLRRLRQSVRAQIQTTDIEV